MTWLGEQLGRIADDMPERDLSARAIAVHRRRRRNFAALAAAVVVVVTLVAVTVGVRALPGEPRPASRPSSPPELSTVRVGLLPTVEAAPVYVAQKEGYFQEEGLTVEPMTVTGPAAVVPRAMSGGLDLAQTDYATVFQTNEAGLQFKIVSSLYRSEPGDLAVVVNAESKIRTLRDLKGKKVAVPNLVGLGPLALTATLNRAGVDRLDYVLVEKPYPEMLDGLDTGAFDAALLAEPYVTVGRETERIRIVADVMTGKFVNLHTAGLAAPARWARENPRTLAAFQRALAKAQHLIASDPGRVREVLPRYTKLTPHVAARFTFGSYPDKLDMRELQRVADLAHAHGLIKRPADLGRALGG